MARKSLNTKIEKSFLRELVDEKNKNYASQFGKGFIAQNITVPKMLLTTLSQFAKKPQGELTLRNALDFYRAINRDLGKVEYNRIKRWRKENKLTFFGTSQYSLLENYLKNVK